MKSLSEDCRITLWRRAIFLFRKFKNSEGAFHKAGFAHFRIEQKMIGLNEIKPDIIAWRLGTGNNDDSVLILELTLNENASKHNQLLKYRALESNQLNPLGISISDSPEVILGIPVPSKMDCDYCHIILGESLLYEGIEILHDEKLIESLKKSKDCDLTQIPSTPFSIVPESKFMEIRRGIAPIILQMFSPSIQSFTAEEIADKALDILIEHMDLKIREQIISDVKVQIEGLVKGYLKDYIDIKGELFSLTDKGKTVCVNSKSREKIKKQINAWMYEKNLDSFT